MPRLPLPARHVARWLWACGRSESVLHAGGVLTAAWWPDTAVWCVVATCNRSALLDHLSSSGKAVTVHAHTGIFTYDMNVTISRPPWDSVLCRYMYCGVAPTLPSDITSRRDPCYDQDCLGGLLYCSYSNLTLLPDEIRDSDQECLGVLSYCSYSNLMERGAPFEYCLLLSGRHDKVTTLTQIAIVGILLLSHNRTPAGTKQGNHVGTRYITIFI